MHLKVEKLIQKIAIPFNLISLVVVTISGWFTYKNTGFSYSVWLPVFLISIGLLFSILGKKYN